MRKTMMIEAESELVLAAATAADLMTPNPISIRDSASVREAVTLLIDRGITAAPVIDKAGRAVGVVSRSDIIAHDRERIQHVPEVSECYARAELSLASGDDLREGFQIEGYDDTCVTDIMTPVVFSVSPQTPAKGVIENMLGWQVHRLFVVDDTGILVGVITTLDILKHLSA